jgi:hypothetical protein
MHRIHRNRVLYKDDAQPGHRYKQIVVIEGSRQFEVHTCEGDVLQVEPDFEAGSTDAVVTFHPDLNAALEDAERQHEASMSAGWVPHNP